MSVKDIETSHQGDTRQIVDRKPCTVERKNMHWGPEDVKKIRDLFHISQGGGFQNHRDTWDKDANGGYCDNHDYAIFVAEQTSNPDVWLDKRVFNSAAGRLISNGGDCKVTEQTSGGHVAVYMCEKSVCECKKCTQKPQETPQTPPDPPRRV